MISFKNNQSDFINKLNENQQIVQEHILDFLGQLSKAITNGNTVEISYNSYIENVDIIYNGILVDIYASRSIMSSNFPFIVFELNVQGESVLIPSPILTEDTVEYNDHNWNKYYLLDTIMNMYAKDLDPRFTIKINN